MVVEKMQLNVVTTTDTDVKATITEIYIPAFHGIAGVLGNHKPYVTLLKPGEISYKDIDDMKYYLYIRDGILEVLKNKISIISDSVERGEALDPQLIEEKLAELDKRIKSSLKGDISPEELEQALEEQREYAVKQKIIQKMEQGK
jgi:F-type H+-transporting ATPase subunit epsilon